MEAYNKFNEELQVRAKAMSDAYALAYVQRLLKNLMLTIPEASAVVERETSWLRDFNLKDGYHSKTQQINEI